MALGKQMSNLTATFLFNFLGLAAIVAIGSSDRARSRFMAPFSGITQDMLVAQMISTLPSTTKDRCMLESRVICQRMIKIIFA